MIVTIFEIGNSETQRDDWCFQVVTGRENEIVLKTFLSLKEATTWCDKMGYNYKCRIEFEGAKHFVKLL